LLGVQQTVTTDTQGSGILGGSDFYTARKNDIIEEEFGSQTSFKREESEPVSERVSSKEINKPTTVEEKTLVVQEGNGRSLRQSPTVSCYKWL
jgi:hypothetical protein